MSNVGTVQISGAPHVRKKITTRRIMLDVHIALIPATVAGLVFFGARAAVTIIISLFASVATEFVWLLCKKTSFKEYALTFSNKNQNSIKAPNEVIIIGATNIIFLFLL